MHLRRVVCVVLLVAFPTLAQDSAEPEPANVFEAGAPLALSVSGGVSMGNYEAGYLYYLTLMLHENPRFARAKVFTGASAGSANALLAALALCRPPEYRVSRSTFYRVWVPVGVQSLYAGHAASPTSLFGADAFQHPISVIEEAWNQGLSERCDVLFGLTTTRLVAQPTTLEPGVQLPRSEAKVSVRITGRGEGRPPRLTNFVDVNDPIGRPYLLTEADGQVPFDELMGMVKASGAFPLAMTPVRQAVCTTGTSKTKTAPTCQPEDAELIDFVDGGIFDNQPLRFAVHLAMRGLSFDGKKLLVRATPSLAETSLSPTMNFIFHDPDVYAFPRAREESAATEDSLLPFVANFAGQLVGSARTKELQALLEERPSVRTQLSATRMYFPALSRGLFGFLGFFEHDFREFDFYLGMHDAQRFVEQVVLPRTEGLSVTQVSWPEQVAATKGTAERHDWRAFHCLRWVLDHDERGRAACEPDLENLRAAAEVTLERLANECAEAATQAHTDHVELAAPHHPACARAFEGQPPEYDTQRIEPPDAWRRAAGEDPLDYQFRRLGAAGFRFTDTLRSSTDGARALKQVRRSVNAMLTSLSEAQPRDALGSKLITRELAQSLIYVPPKWAFHLTLGSSAELGASGRLGPGIRGTTSLQVTPTLDLGGSRLSAVVAPQLGFEADVAGTALLQPRLGLRGGFAFATQDGFASRACQPGLACSRPQAELYGVVTVLQLIRGQAGVRLLPAFRDAPWSAELFLAAGIEFDLQ